MELGLSPEASDVPGTWGGPVIGDGYVGPPSYDEGLFRLPSLSASSVAVRLPGARTFRARGSLARAKNGNFYGFRNTDPDSRNGDRVFFRSTIEMNGFAPRTSGRIVEMGDGSFVFALQEGRGMIGRFTKTGVFSVAYEFEK